MGKSWVQKHGCGISTACRRIRTKRVFPKQKEAIEASPESFAEHLSAGRTS